MWLKAFLTAAGSFLLVVLYFFWYVFPLMTCFIAGVIYETHFGCYSALFLVATVEFFWNHQGLYKYFKWAKKFDREQERTARHESKSLKIAS